MLSNSVYEEAANGVVTIPDFDSSAVQELLHYLYTDSLSDGSVLDNMAEVLLMIACKYQVIGLIAVCESYLEKHISADTVVVFLRLADTYDAKRLKEKCLYFVSQNLSICEGKDFQDLTETLAKEVLSFVELHSRKRTYSCYGTCREGRGSKFASCIII
jgi:hypothetical protein